jgi:resuscitation-promoting factor RpfB
MTDSNRGLSDEPRSPPMAPRPPFTPPHPHLPPTATSWPPSSGGMPPVSGPPGYGPAASGYGQPVPLGPPVPPPRQRLGAGAIVAIVFGGLVALCLILGAVVALVSPASNKKTPTGQQRAVTTTSATPSATAGSLSPTLGEQPAIETRTVTETQEIPFEEKTVNDPSLAVGASEVRTQGVAGVKTLTYQVTLTNGVQTDKKLLSEVVTTAPITQVTANGTKQERRCDPNYSGACVPIASDVDCAGGSGNGPAYVKGPVKVIGSDIYDLDRDGDGYGCE